MNQQPIGVFDSGVGGLALVRQLRRLMPDEPIVCLCDTARAPYGSHSRQLSQKNALQGLAFLERQQVKLLATACGTVSAVLDGGTAEKSLSTPFLSALLPCAQEACAASATGRIGLIGSPTAVHCPAFGRAVRSIRPDARLIGMATPLLGSIAEHGGRDDYPLLQMAIRQYLAPLIREEIDTLILSSPYYSVLFEAINETTDYQITLIDSSYVLARSVQSWLTQNSLQAAQPGQPPVWYVTDAPEEFSASAPRYYGAPLESQPLLAALD